MLSGPPQGASALTRAGGWNASMLFRLRLGRKRGP